MRIGDVILVRRRLSWKTWLIRPISSLVTWRIQRTTGSKWNHVAGYIGRGRIVEAEWNWGVREAPLSVTYPVDQFEVAIAEPPDTVDTDEVRAFWVKKPLDRKARYDWRAILVMRLAAILGGHKGIRNYVHANTNDSAWICSELCAAGWRAGGFIGSDQALLVPGDFDAYRIEP